MTTTKTASRTYRATIVRTVGISPKVYVPAIGQLVVGVGFLVLGLDVEGKTAIATGLATLAAGFRAPAGDAEVSRP